MPTATAPPVSSANDPKLRKAADLLKLGSEPIRDHVMLALRDGGLETSELADEVGIDRMTLAHHVRLLRVAALVTSDRIGRRTIHALTARGRSLLSVIDTLSRD